MNRYLLSTLFLAFLALNGRAQVQVIMLRDTARYNLSPSQMEALFPPAMTRITARSGTTMELKGAFSQKQKQFFDTLQARRLQFLQFFDERWKQMPVEGVFVQVNEFIRPDGSYQWVLCTFPGVDLKPEQEQKMLALLQEWYTRKPFPLQTPNGFSWSTTSQIGRVPEKRVVRHGAGMISTQEEAQRTNRPDTVKMLAFNQLKLATIPEVVYRFPNLEEIDFSKNQLQTVPLRLTSDIPTLQKLSVLYNHITDDSLFFARNKHLVALNLQGNKFTRIPKAVRNNRRLQSLWMGNNKLTAFDRTSLRHLRHLNDLNLYNTGLTQLPASIGRLKRLTVLDLYYNKLTTLPRQLRKLSHLEQLALAHNDLKTLPVAVTQLKHLQVLYAHHNQLSQLPTNFQNLAQLRILDLGYNWFSVAPPVLSRFSTLDELSLNNNNLQEFPEVVLSIKNLRKVFLGSNPVFGREALKSPYAAQIKQLEANHTDVSY